MHQEAMHLEIIFPQKRNGGYYAESEQQSEQQKQQPEQSEQ